MRCGLQKSKGIEIGFEISPLAVEVEDAFALAIRGFHQCGTGAVAGLGLSGGHMISTRIKDAAAGVIDS